MTARPAARRRDELERFYRTYRQLLMARATRRVVIDPARVEDACQTAWAILARRPDVTLDERGLAWLTRVAIREAWRIAANELLSAWDPDDLLALAVADIDDPVDRVIDRERHERRAADLAALKPAERTALGLYAIGHSYSEIAALTGSSYTAVNRRLAEGRARLRSVAAGRGPDER